MVFVGEENETNVIIAYEENLQLLHLFLCVKNVWCS